MIITKKIVIETKRLTKDELKKLEKIEKEYFQTEQNNIGKVLLKCISLIEIKE